ncbi:NAD(P)/FAD-dependent oxidoreductase [Allokutzneria oryzae]|uniref:NAD(P)/FAD-dependent oxidoreductase n=1 Tax=Allokutzneria oryzae TaxID=1378989 RepID=A0ABV6A393_9PSEU
MGMRHGVVLGGGLAGMLTASVLARHLDAVTVIERDRLPAGPLDRAGSPQGRHTHAFAGGGVAALDRLLPGMVDELVKAGARRIRNPEDVLILTTAGWLPRYQDMESFLSASRRVIDWSIRERVLADVRISVRQATDVTGLAGDAGRVTGVRLRSRETRATDELAADLVVDATGRGSHAPRWLREIGVPEVREELVDPGIVYVTKVFRALPGTEDDFPAIMIADDPRSERPGRGALLLPVEDGQWMLTLSGRRGVTPPSDDEGFHAFARELPHPILSKIIEMAEPVSRMFRYDLTSNRRRRYDRLRPAPEGFVAIGDAHCSFNPVYGHGMTVSVFGALALHETLGRQGLQPSTARLAQKAVARATDPVWAMARSQDVRFRGTTGTRMTMLDRVQEAYGRRLQRAAIGSRDIVAAQLSVFELAGPPTQLLAPKIIRQAMRRPRATGPTEPPLTERERAALRIG